MRNYDKLKKLEIKDQCNDLPLDASKLLHCPYCGAEHERSLSVTRKSSGLVFNCFRAKCGVGGFINSISSVPHVSEVKKKWKPYQGRMHRALEEEIMYLYNTYGIDMSYADEIYLNEDGRYMFPSFSIYQHGIAGWQDRRFDGIGKKVVFYPQAAGPYYQVLKNNSIHKYAGRPIMYIVEDYISMLKVQMAIDMEHINGKAVSLMGTHITDEMAMWLSKTSSNIVFMLDNDATHKSIKYKHQYNLLWPDAKAVLMEHDPKDTDINILRSLVAV